MNILLPLLVAVISLLVYALSANPKVSELGRLSFFAGLFVFLYVYATHVVHIGG